MRFQRRLGRIGMATMQQAKILQKMYIALKTSTSQRKSCASQGNLRTSVPSETPVPEINLKDVLDPADGDGEGILGEGTFGNGF